MAIRALEDSRTKKPDDPDVLYHLGMTYAKRGDQPKAREALERALTVNPAFASAESARQPLVTVSQ